MNFKGLQFLVILIFLGGATSLYKLQNAYETSEQKALFPYEPFDDIEKLRHTELPTADEFYSKLKNWKQTSLCTIVYSKRGYLAVLL